MGGKLLLGIGLFVAFVGSGSQASASPVAAGPRVIVDENGHGVFIDSSGTKSSLPLDTTVPGAPLVYDLPFLVSIGDVVLTEGGVNPATNQAIPSDVIRFANHDTGTANAGGQLIFYSDLESGETTHDLADIDLSTITIDTSDNSQVFNEVGMEGGLNGRIYTPGLTAAGGAEPGFDESVTSGPQVQYALISDGALPLPASAWAGLALLAGFGAWRVIRKRAAI